MSKEQRENQCFMSNSHLTDSGFATWQCSGLNQFKQLILVPPIWKGTFMFSCQLWYRVAFSWNSVQNKINKWFVKVETSFWHYSPSFSDITNITFALHYLHLFRDWIRLHEVSWVLHVLTSAHLGCYYSDMARSMCITIFVGFQSAWWK